MQRRSKIVTHPSAGGSPEALIAEALGIAQSGQMADMVVLWVDKERGNYRICWSSCGNHDLAAYGAVLTHVAASRLIEEE
jgi:hypothetical protein